MPVPNTKFSKVEVLYKSEQGTYTDILQTTLYDVWTRDGALSIIGNDGSVACYAEGVWLVYKLTSAKESA